MNFNKHGEPIDSHLGAVLDALATSARHDLDVLSLARVEEATIGVDRRVVVAEAIVADARLFAIADDEEGLGTKDFGASWDLVADEEAASCVGNARRADLQGNAGGRDAAQEVDTEARLVVDRLLAVVGHGDDETENGEVEADGLEK